MSAVDKNSIQDKLLKLQEAVNVLNELKSVSEQDFLKDLKTNGAAMFNMLVSIELIVDIGNHILAEVFQKPEKTYRDVILALGGWG